MFVNSGIYRCHTLSVLAILLSYTTKTCNRKFFSMSINNFLHKIKEPSHANIYSEEMWAICPSIIRPMIDYIKVSVYI